MSREPYEGVARHSKQKLRSNATGREPYVGSGELSEGAVGADGRAHSCSPKSPYSTLSQSR